MSHLPNTEDALLIRDLPIELRPRQRLVYAGPNALSNAELLAIILRMGGVERACCIWRSGC